MLATGVSYRSLGVPGCEELTGAGVYYGSALTEAAECADREVYIVGGAALVGLVYWFVYLRPRGRDATSTS